MTVTIFRKDEDIDIRLRLYILLSSGLFLPFYQVYLARPGLLEVQLDPSRKKKIKKHKLK